MHFSFDSKFMSVRQIFTLNRCLCVYCVCMYVSVDVYVYNVGPYNNAFNVKYKLKYNTLRSHTETEENVRRCRGLRARDTFHMNLSLSRFVYV